MPLPLDCAGAESQLSRTPLPVPVPAFFQEAERSFSAKRPGRPLSYTLPPRPRHKGTLTVSRVFTGRQPQPWSQPRPRSVSFRSSQVRALAPRSRLYDPARREPFFSQCFQLLGRLGRGSFGEVYKVRSKEDGRLYAVKRSVEPFRGAGDRQRKLAEVRKHERVGRHPNCVSFVRAWEERGQLYIQTELCPASLLQHCEGRGTLPEGQVRACLWDLLQALRHLHACGLLHMDVKPANVFLTERRVCKLGDFGLVLELDRGDLSDAQEGDPRYMAPELLRGEYSEAADVFSLGMTILEIACNMELPNGGEGWQQLRQGYLPPEFTAGKWGSPLLAHMGLLMATQCAMDPASHMETCWNWHSVWWLSWEGAGSQDSWVPSPQSSTLESRYNAPRDNANSFITWGESGPGCCSRRGASLAGTWRLGSMTQRLQQEQLSPCSPGAPLGFSPLSPAGPTPARILPSPPTDIGGGSVEEGSALLGAGCRVAQSPPGSQRSRQAGGSRLWGPCSPGHSAGQSAAAPQPCSPGRSAAGPALPAGPPAGAQPTPRRLSPSWQSQVPPQELGPAGPGGRRGRVASAPAEGSPGHPPSLSPPASSLPLARARKLNTSTVEPLL